MYSELTFVYLDAYVVLEVLGIYECYSNRRNKVRANFGEELSLKPLNTNGSDMIAVDLTTSMDG